VAYLFGYFSDTGNLSLPNPEAAFQDFTFLWRKLFMHPMGLARP
jgi:hypothetical protein